VARIMDLTYLIIAIIAMSKVKSWKDKLAKKITHFSNF